MVDFKEYLDHLRRTAFSTSDDLPEPYRARCFCEGERVLSEVLAPRGLSRRQILLVGGAGYIGAPLTAALLEREYRVRCIDLLLYGNHAAVTPFLGHPNYQFRHGDMARAQDVDEALDGITDIIILAGLVGDPITRQYPRESEEINDRGLVRLLGRLPGRGLNKVVFVSTCSNYGEIPMNATADEAFPLKPLSLYAEAKVKVETVLLKNKGNVDYHGSVLRFATAFGLSPRMRFDLTVSEFTRALFVNRKLEVYDADTWRPYCHVRDFARALIRVLEAPAERVSFEVFNAGGDINNYTKEMIAQHIKGRLPDAELRYVQGGVDRRNYRVDFSKIRNALYFEPRFTVSDGVDELIAALEQGFFADYEMRKDFYRNQSLTYELAR